MKRLIVMGILITGLLLFIRCMPCAPCAPVGKKLVERTIEKKIEKETGEKVDVEIGKTRLPSGFPKELAYPGAEVKGRFSVLGKGHTVVLATQDKASRVKEYYEDLKYKGWEEVMVAEGMGKEGEGVMLTLRKGEHEGFMVTIARDKKTGKTLITIIYGKE